MDAGLAATLGRAVEKAKADGAETVPVLSDLANKLGLVPTQYQVRSANRGVLVAVSDVEALLAKAPAAAPKTEPKPKKPAKSKAKPETAPAT